MMGHPAPAAVAPGGWWVAGDARWPPRLLWDTASGVLHARAPSRLCRCSARAENGFPSSEGWKKTRPRIISPGTDTKPYKTQISASRNKASPARSHAPLCLIGWGCCSTTLEAANSYLPVLEAASPRSVSRRLRPGEASRLADGRLLPLRQQQRECVGLRVLLGEH